jgi:protein-S-isoprenylcysteine O-methyltransferase Ste14
MAAGIKDLFPPNGFARFSLILTSMSTFLTWLPIASVLAIYTARVLELGTKRNTIRGLIRENLTLRLFIVVGTFVFFSSIAEYFLLRRGIISWPMFVIGWGCGIASFAIRRRAIAALGRFWSLHVEIREEHEFVKSGPFRFVRHPAYFSMVLELVALALICGAAWSLLAVPLLFLPVLYMRVRLEESALVGKFGDAYRQYQQSTPALFPRAW